MSTLQNVLQPQTIHIKSSVLTKNNTSPGIITKIGSFFMSLWKKVTDKSSKEKLIVVDNKSHKETPVYCSEDYASVALPILDPDKFQEQFTYQFKSFNSAISKNNTQYLEDEGFYDEGLLCTPKAKKLAYKEAGVSEDKLSWTETYGGESDTGASAYKEPTFPLNPPLIFSVDNEVLPMIHEPILNLPFITKADISLKLNILTDNYGIPRTVGASEVIQMNRVSLDEMVRFEYDYRICLKWRRREYKMRNRICLI